MKFPKGFNVWLPSLANRKHFPKLKFTQSCADTVADSALGKSPFRSFSTGTHFTVLHLDWVFLTSLFIWALSTRSNS